MTGTALRQSPAAQGPHISHNPSVWVSRPRSVGRELAAAPRMPAANGKAGERRPVTRGLTGRGSRSHLGGFARARREGTADQVGPALVGVWRTGPAHDA